MYGLLQIKHIRRYLTREACELLVHGLVILHIDYCNSLFAGLPDIDIGKLQRVQNTAVKVILQKTRYDSVMVCLKELHWLPVRSRINHKILGLVYDALNCTGPEYLQELLTLYEPTHSGLRSSNTYKQLQVPLTKRKTFADRSFSVYGAKLWNSIPEGLQKQPTLQDFKKHLKTYLFTKAFN